MREKYGRLKRRKMRLFVLSIFEKVWDSSLLALELIASWIVIHVIFHGENQCDPFLVRGLLPCT